jgi:Trk K+ transport system NAD-binding subunit
VVKSGEDIKSVPPPGWELQEGDEIVVCGTNDAIDAISALE